MIVGVIERAVAQATPIHVGLGVDVPQFAAPTSVLGLVMAAHFGKGSHGHSPCSSMLAKLFTSARAKLPLAAYFGEGEACFGSRAPATARACFGGALRGGHGRG